jgi:hypothetical protein
MKLMNDYPKTNHAIHNQQRMLAIELQHHCAQLGSLSLRDDE